MMRFPSQPTEDQDERSWTPNEVDGPRTRPEEPGTRITGRCALRDGSASSRSMPTGIRSIAARRSERNPKPAQALRFLPGSVTGARRIFDCSRTLHPHTDFSMREVGERSFLESCLATPLIARAAVHSRLEADADAARAKSLGRFLFGAGSRLQNRFGRFRVKTRRQQASASAGWPDLRKRDYRPHRPTVQARRGSANLGPLRVSWKANRRLTQTGACVHHPGIELEKMRRIS